MKRMLLLIIIIIAISTIKTNAQCKIPAGVSTSPAWIQGTPDIEVKFKADDDNCKLKVKWCYRYNGTDKEIILGDYVLDNDFPWWDAWCDCEDEFNSKKEMLMDRAIGVITMTYNAFGIAESIQPCDEFGNPPQNSPHVFKIYTSKCKTVPYYDFINNNGNQVISPCTGSGYCKYEYKYCSKVIANENHATYTRTVLGGESSQCPENHEIAPTIYKDCLPADCYVTPRINIKFISEVDMGNTNYSDSNYYSMW